MPYTPMELAEVFIKTGELKDALDALNQQLSDYPADTHALRLRASLLLRMSDKARLEQALQDIDAITEKKADDKVLQSVIYERLGQYDDAIKAMQAAHDLSPDDERIVERQVELLRLEKRYDEALSLIQQIPQSWRWVQLAADIFVLKNEDESALALYHQAQDELEKRFDFPPPHIRATLARLYLAQAHIQRRQKQFEDALTNFQQAQDYLPDDASIQFNIGLIRALQGDLARATEICSKALVNTTDYLRQMMLESLNEDEKFASLRQSLNS